MSHSTTDFVSPDAAAGFFDGMDLVPSGIVALPDWHADLPPAERPSAADVSCYSAVARIR